MDDRQINAKLFNQYGYLHYKFTDYELLPIRQEVDAIQQDFETPENLKCNYSLAGHIKRQFSLVKSRSYINDLLQPLTRTYPKYFEGRDANYTIDMPWVNFQEKYDFNPNHTHNGELSFVLWLQVPFLIEDENKVYPDVPTHGERCAGCFQFTYASAVGMRHEVLPVDKTWENTVIVFPSMIIHTVYPFYTSDEYRISVSGNFM